MEKDEIKGVFEEEEKNWGEKCRSSAQNGMRAGRLDAFWPDFPGSWKYTWTNGGWNIADVDELGPIGLFAVGVFYSPS